MSAADRTDAVLDAIDGALADRAVSRDAMRWTPDPPDKARAAADTKRYGLGGEQPAYRPPAQRTSDPPGINGILLRAQEDRLTPEDVEAMRASMRAFTEAMRPVMQSLGRAFAELTRSRRRAPTRADFTLIPPGSMDASLDLNARRRALEARRNRGTGPPPDRLDGRRTRP